MPCKSPQGLTAAHDRHIVHRDLKPENMFLTNDERIKILDFGVAKLQAHAGEASLRRKSYYRHQAWRRDRHGRLHVPRAAPRQEVDHRSDIFSFGAILYEMLSGKRAFRGETEVDTMTAVLLEDLPTQTSSRRQSRQPIRTSSGTAWKRIRRIDFSLPRISYLRCKR